MLSFSYLEPMTWWMPMATNPARIPSADGDDLEVGGHAGCSRPALVESTPDLRSWRPQATNTPPESPSVHDLPGPLAVGAQFYRLRY
jgi:hypothetical protein